jgi:DNA (cytosine-5)-methyltransferase 1
MGSSGADGLGHFGRRSEADRFWGTVDWLFCQDGKWRPVEPGTLPLAHGAPSRVVRLRAYGNAINAEQATIFVEAFLEKDLCGRSNLTCADDLI